MFTSNLEKHELFNFDNYVATIRNINARADTESNTMETIDFVRSLAQDCNDFVGRVDELNLNERNARIGLSDKILTNVLRAIRDAKDRSIFGISGACSALNTVANVYGAPGKIFTGDKDNDDDVLMFCLEISVKLFGKAKENERLSA